MIAQGLVERLRLKGAARHPGPSGRTGSRARDTASARRTVNTASGDQGLRAASRRQGVRRRRLSRRARIGLLVTAALGLLLVGAWTWFRQSPLVSVNRVTVSGETGPDAGQISAALDSAARTMSTLNVQLDRLRRAVAPYPVVKDIRVTTRFPHAMHIEVIEQVAVGAIDAGGRRIAVSGDGTLLHDVVPSAALPTIPMSSAPAGARVTGGAADQAIKLLAAAPAQLLTKISQVTSVPPHGLVAQVRGGPSIYFGEATELAQKWVAASDVLAAPGSAGAPYIDVTDPQRPAAGAGSDTQSSQGPSGTATTTSASTAAGTTDPSSSSSTPSSSTSSPSTTGG